MINMFFGVFKGIFNIFKFPLIFLVICLSIFIFFCAFWFIIFTLKGKRLKKGTRNFIKKDNFFIKLFFKLPKQIVLDIFDRDPDYFRYQGCIIFEGRQGAGKTISMIEFLKRMQKEYPRALCTTNLGYSSEDCELTDWRMLLTYKNGIYGVMVGIDELQNWFSSNDSKNFPADMLEIITQNRKNRRIILGTSQNFYLLAKAIRSQATELRRCSTLFGALTIVRRFTPILDSEGNVQEFRKLGWYFFVHDKELRESYDTYKVIHRLSKVGFQEQSNNLTENNTYNLINFRKK